MTDPPNFPNTQQSWHVCPQVALQCWAYNPLPTYQAFIPSVLFQAQGGMHAWVPPAHRPSQVEQQCPCFSMRPGPVIISSSHRLAVWLCMFQAGFTAQSHFKIHHPSPNCWCVFQRQKTLALAVVGGQRPCPVNITQTGRWLSQWFTVHSKRKSQFPPDYLWM